MSHVLEGTVAQRSGRVRVDGAARARGRSRADLGAHATTATLKDVLSLQARVATDVARSVQGTLTADARPARRRSIPRSTACSSQARHFWHLRTASGFRKALTAHREDVAAATLVGGRPRGHRAVVDGARRHGAVSRRRGVPAGREAVLHALELDPDLARPTPCPRGARRDRRHDWAAAEQGYRRALELNPNDAVAHHWYSLMLCIQGRQQESIDEARKAYASDPASPVIANNLAVMLLVSGRPAEALSQSEIAIELQPDHARGHLIRGESLLMHGRAAEALAAFERAATLQPEDRPRTSIFRARALAAAGRPQEGERLLNALISNDEWREGRYDFYDRAAVLGQIGRHDDAFEALRKAIEARESGVRFVLYDPAMDRLQGDPRLNEIARRLRLKG